MVEFIESTHTYVNSKGIIIPSVSELVEFAFPGTYQNVPQSVLDKASQYGTAVHEILEEYDKGHTETAYQLAVADDDMLNALGNYSDLKKKWAIYPKSQEQIIDYKERYAGRYDKLDETNTLWDVKTNSKKMLDKWAVQLGLYYMALGVQKESAYVIWLPKRNKAQIVPVCVWSHDECLRLLDDYEKSRVADEKGMLGLSYDGEPTQA